MKQAGRKYRAFLICVILSVGLFVYTGYNPELQPSLGAILTALGSYFTIYAGANVAQKKFNIDIRNKSGDIKDGSTQ